MRKLFWIWLVAYPLLPVGPLFCLLIASLLGPPFVVGLDANGWPIFGRITPYFVGVTIGLPWAIGAWVLYRVSRTEVASVR